MSPQPLDAAPRRTWGSTFRDICRHIWHNVLHNPWLWLGLIVVLGVAALSAIFVGRNIAQKPPARADLFIQSVVNQDARLGWNQLCPALQEAVPLSDLMNQVQQQHDADGRLNLSLTSDYVGAHARSQGGEIRMYVVTAHRPDGWVAQRTYVIFTQTNGCVDDISTS